MKEPREILCWLAWLAMLMWVNCTQSQRTSKAEDTHTLRLTHTKSFLLDSLTPPLTGMTQYIEINNERYVCMLNVISRDILFYHYEQGRLAFKLKQLTEGPNKLRPTVDFLVHTLDSVFVSDGYYTISLINRKGQILDSWFAEGTSDIPGFITPDLQVETPNALFLHQDTLHITGIVFGQYLSPVIKLHLSERTVEYVGQYPPRYQQNGHWRGFDHYNYAYIPTDSGGRFVYSFEADPNLYVASMTDHAFLASHPAASRYIGKIRPFYRHAGQVTSTQQLDFNICHSHAYGPVFYDKYREVFYRFVFLASDEASCKKGLIKSHSLNHASIILLDGKFNILGEVKLPPQSYIPSATFITKEGLHLAPFEQENEDQLTFEVYQLSPVSNETI